MSTITSKFTVMEDERTRLEADLGKKNWGQRWTQPISQPWFDTITGFFAELFGSWLFVFIAAGAGAIQPFLSAPDSLLFGIAGGFGLTAAIWIASYVRRAGHINPVVSIMFWIYGLFEPNRGRGNPGRLWWFNWMYLLLWITAQFIGAIIAAALLLAIFGNASNLGRPIVGPGFSWERAFAYEIIGSTMLLFLYLFLVWNGRLMQENKWNTMRRWYSVPIGITYLVLAIIGAFISTASFNWWRHIGPTLISNTWDSVADVNDGVIGTDVDWIWYVGPLAGAIAALLIFAVYWAIWYFVTRREITETMTSTGTRFNLKKVTRSLKKKKGNGNGSVYVSGNSSVEQLTEELFE